MAGSAVEDCPFACPIPGAFAVCTANPVTFLAEMALAAELITMIKVYLIPLFILQVIPFVGMVAVNAAKRRSLAVIELNFTMG